MKSQEICTDVKTAAISDFIPGELMPLAQLCMQGSGTLDTLLQLNS